MAGNPIYNTKQWREVRRLVLEEDGDCHWCRLHGKRTKATQVDHIVELDRGGDPYDRSNLVPSCASCNSSRGATFVNNKTAQRIQSRNKATQNVSFSAKQSRDSGRTGSLYFAEWSLPPGVSLEDRRYWGWANPALGTTITMKALELAFDSPNRQAFIRGHLNLWLDSTNPYLPLNLWQDRQTVDPMPAIQWLVIDSSVDESRYVGIGCAYDGTRVIVTTEFVVESAQQMWAEVVKRMSDPQVKLACTPSLEIHCPPDLRRRMTIVGYAELVKWTGAARAMIVEDRVRHTGDLALSEHFARAVAVKTGGAIVLSSQKSPGPIELARCSVWGIMLTSRPKATAKPQMAFG
jgi:hypothetical protein